MKRNLGRLFEEYLRLKEEVEAAREERRVNEWGYRYNGPELEWQRCRREISEQMGAHERIDYDDCMGRKWTFWNMSYGVRCYKRKDKRDLGAVDRQGRIKQKEITELEEVILGDLEDKA